VGLLSLHFCSLVVVIAFEHAVFEGAYVVLVWR
jgi:hypothetical protein